MRWLLATILVVLGCKHDGELAHAAEVFCHARANEWARLADQYQARSTLATPSDEADATYGILTPDARRMWASDASSSFALCFDIRVLDTVRAHELEARFATAHDPFLQGSPSVRAQADQLTEMAGVMSELNRQPTRD